MSDLYQLVYLSAAVELFNPEQIKALMAQAVENNARAGITGILLYKDGNFLQAIEGSDAAITALFAKISADPRHRKIIRVMKTPIAEREFKDWSMAFRDLSSPEVRSLPGFNDFLVTPLLPSEFTDNPSKVKRLLQSFRQAVR